VCQFLPAVRRSEVRHHTGTRHGKVFPAVIRWEMLEPTVSAPRIVAALQPPPGLRFVARQPILDRAEQVYGYEILFRDGLENHYNAPDAEDACRQTLHSSFLMGLEQLTDGKRMFLNCTGDVLLADYAHFFHPENVILEILETVVPGNIIEDACRRLKKAGYGLALDDYVANDPRQSLLPMASILKVDWPHVSPEECGRMVAEHHPQGRLMLAEKIETREDFALAKELQFDYFQGYFFQRPVILSVQEVPAHKLSALLLLSALAQAELDLKEVERLIKSDAGLCYRLLRYLNSPLFSMASEIRSVHHALRVLGERNTRKWISLVAVIDAGRDASNILLQTALARARFCELAATEARLDSESGFFLGLMSLMDAILQVSVPVLLERVALAPQVKQALLEEAGPMAPLLNLVRAQDSGEWEIGRHYAAQLGMSEDQAFSLFWQAAAWARETCKG
jgi:c-di-GMP-related signal transduction protein